MDESSFYPCEGTVFHRLPSIIERHRNEFGTKCAHSLHLRRRCRLYHDDRAWHARLTRRVGHTLPGVPGANRPDSAAAFRFRQHRHGIGRTPQFICVNRLQVLQFEVDSWKMRPHFETNQGRSENGVRDSLPRFMYFLQFNRADRFQDRGHGNGVSDSPAGEQEKSRQKEHCGSRDAAAVFYERFSYTLTRYPCSSASRSPPLAGTTKSASLFGRAPAPQEHNSF